MRAILTLAVLGGTCFLLLQPQTVATRPTSECVSMDELFEREREPTTEEIYAAEQCMKQEARAAGRSGRSSRFLGNTYDRPPGALAHYRFAWDTGRFTVFADRIVATDPNDTDEVEVPMERITDVVVLGQVLRVEYLDERGSEKSVGLTLASDEDPSKEDGARDIDRLHDLIEAKRPGRY